MPMMPTTKRKVTLLFGLLGLAIFSVSLVTVFCVPRWLEVSPNWDGGRWSDAQTLPFPSGEVVEYDGKLFMFYSNVTKDTTHGNDDAFGPDEYQLWDIFYKTYDGTNYGQEAALTSPADEVRVHADFVVHADKLYAVLREEWISNYTSYEWASRVSMKFFDGDEWHEAPGPYAEGELLYGAPQYFAFGGEIWAVRKDQEPNIYMPNEFSYKTYNGSSWSAPRNFSFPTGEPNTWKFVAVDSQLWVVWESVTVQTYQPPYHREEDIYVGHFDGENWQNVTRLSPLEDRGSNIWPSAVAYQNELFVFWRSEHFGQPDLVFRRLNLSDGRLSGLSKASLDAAVKIYFAEIRLYDGKLYLLGGNVIWNFNGTSWSSGYTFPDRSYSQLFVFGGKLWVKASTSINGQTPLRSYVKKG